MLAVLVTWLAVNIILIATGWYALKIKRYYPDWWRRFIADEIPPEVDLDTVFEEETVPRRIRLLRWLHLSGRRGK